MCNISFFRLIKVLEAQMKVDLADKESLEAKRAQQEEESRENSKLISEQKAVRKYETFTLYSLKQLSPSLWLSITYC